MERRRRGVVKPYPETHQQGHISVENMPESHWMDGDFGIRIASDGRVWVCINGVAFIRFKPTPHLVQLERKGKEE